MIKLNFKEDFDKMIYLVLYIDGILIASKSIDQREALKQQLKGEYEMKDLRLVKKILGM